MKTKHLSAALLLPCAAVAAEIREYSRDAAFIEDYRRGAIAMCRKMTDRVNASLPDHDLPGRPGVRCGRQFSAGGHFEQFFIWDTSFSVMWARLFPQENFPIEEALDNFYTFQEPSGYICREIFNDGRIAWKAPHPVGLNPPLLAWAELESYRAGVTSAERLRRVLPNLEKFHEFYRRHCRRADGLYFSTLLGCGMDDLPRWPVGMKEDDLSEGGLVFTRDDIGEAYAKSAWDDKTDWIYRLRKKQNWNRQAGWIDTSAQMAFDCLNLAEIAEIVGDGAKAAAYRAEHAETAEAINRLCWDEEKGFYFDCWKKGLIHRWQAGAFWTLIAKVAPPDRAKRMLAALFNEEIFWCASGIRCLGRNDPDYSPYETYWCGSVWPPVMYMTIKGLAAYGFDAEADRVARRWYDANALMWERHRDIYENLQPDEPDTLREGLMGGEWTGWSALAALALPVEMGWVGLKDMVPFRLGVAVRNDQVTGEAKGEREIIERHFNEVTPENDMKSVTIQPAEGRFDFAKADRLVDWARSRGMKVMGHVLVWHEQKPGWFTKGENGEALCTKEVMRKRLRDHIHGVVGHFRGRVDGWDVVNEAIEWDGKWRENEFWKILGEEYVELAFRYAHEADPDAELWYNDYNNECAGRNDAIAAMIRDFKAKGVRIDGIGMQGHLGVDIPVIPEYERAINLFAAEGVKVAITEMDMRVAPNMWSVDKSEWATASANPKYNPWTDGNLPKDVETAEAKYYASFFTMLRRHAKVVDRVTFWGLSDKDSWLNLFPVAPRMDFPLLFDRDCKLKPWARKSLLGGW